MRTKFSFILFTTCALASAAFAGVEQTVNDLLPKLAATNVAERYAPQMELQSLAVAAARPGAEAERLAFARVLAARAGDASVPQPARVWLVRQLEYIGAAEAVPTLTALLKNPDAELRECARRALEKNAAPAATKTLRAALAEGGDTSWQIGLIQSLGQRRDAESVVLIAKALDNAQTAPAAASALAKIHSNQAVQALVKALDQKNSSAIDGLLQAANLLLAEGDKKHAAAIYEKVYATCEGGQWRAAALNGFAKAAPGDAKKLVVAALSSSDPRMLQAALSAAQVVYGEHTSSELASQFPRLSPAAKLMVVRALDASAEPQVIQAVADSDPAVQVAALETLGRIGSAASVPVLLDTAAGRATPARNAAAASLATISGAGADAAIAHAAAEGKASRRAAAITALGERGSPTPVPVLLKYAGESDRAVSAAAYVALGRVGTEAELEPLAKLTLAGTAPGAEDALRAVASRSQDKDAAAAKLIALVQAAEPAKAPVLFDTLSVLGGDSALKFISTAAASSNAEVSDAAVRALADWSDFTAVKPLLALASAPGAKPLHNVLAIQGVARLVKSAEKEPAGARVDAATEAMKVATRDQEKKLLLSALASVPARAAVAPILASLTNPQLEPEAGQAALSLSQVLFRKDRQAAKDLAHAVKQANISDTLSQRADALLKK